MSNIFSKTLKIITGAHQKEEKLEELKKICEEYNRNRKRLLDNAKTLFEKRKGYCKVICIISAKSSEIKNLPNWFNESINSEE